MSRTDAIGDVVLTLPLAGMIKRRFPECEVWFLVRKYVRPVVDACPHVDGAVEWDELERAPVAIAGRVLAEVGADVILHVFPVRHIARAAVRARIPRRIGTNRRWFHLLTCTDLVNFSRRRSDLHEAELNLKLLGPLGIDADVHLPDVLDDLALEPGAAASEGVGQWIDPVRFNLVLHPGSRGNGREWPEGHYLELAASLAEADFRVMVTGTAEEGRRFTRLCGGDREGEGGGVADLTGRLDLTQLMALLELADGVIASGTGPLHLAAAVGTRTLGIFPTRAGTVGTNRWGPVGRRAEYVVHQDQCADCPGGVTCPCMAAIDVGQVRQVVRRWYETAEAS